MEEKLKQLTFGKALMIGVGLVAAYYFAMYNDGARIQEQIKTTDSEIIRQQQEKAVIEKAIADAERYQSMKKTLGQELDVVLKAIPVELVESDLMKVLSNEAKNVGVNILDVKQTSSSFSTPANGPKPFFAPVSVQVQLEGSYNQLMLFLSNLTKTDRIITVSSLNLQLKEAGGAIDGRGATVLKMDGEFKAYRYIPNTTAPAKGAAGG